MELVANDLDIMTKNIDTWLNEEEQEQSTRNTKQQDKQKKFIAEEHLRKNLEHQRQLGLIEKQVTIEYSIYF